MRAAHDQRHRARAVGDLVRLEQLREPLAHLAVVAHRLGQVLAQEEHALLESDDHGDDHHQRAHADQPARDEGHADAEHREDEEGEEQAVRDQQPLRPPPLAQVGDPLVADRLADVLPLVLDFAGELHGVDVGGGVDHLAAQARRALGVGEAELVQPAHPEDVHRDVDRHPQGEGDGEPGVGEVGDPEVGGEADDPREELPQPLGDQPLDARRGVRDLVDERPGEAVGEVRRGVVGEVAEQAPAGLGHRAGDPAHPAEAARAPDELVGKVDAREDERPAPDLVDVAPSLAQGDGGVGEQLQRVGHDPRRRGGHQHREHGRDGPPGVGPADRPGEGHRPPRDPVLGHARGILTREVAW
jgi:hypothetical protein